MFRSLVTRFPKSICSVKSESPLSFGGLRKISNDSDDEKPSTLENVDPFKCLNRVTLLGRATGPAQGLTLNNIDMAIFTLVTNEIRRNRANELIKRSEFHRVQVYIPKLVNKTKQVLVKGSRVLVEGKINYNIRKTEDNRTISFTNIIAENILFITGNREARNEHDEADLEEVDTQTEAKQ